MNRSLLKHVSHRGTETTEINAIFSFFLCVLCVSVRKYAIIYKNFPEGSILNILLCAINAKFIHSSLAVRSLRVSCVDYTENVEILEFSINNSVEFIVKEIYGKSPDILCFSCYIWNIEIIKDIVEIIRKTRPHVKIVMGGPEVSFAPFELLGDYADIIVHGEGEAVFNELCGYFIKSLTNLSDIKGIAYYSGDVIVVNEPHAPLDLNALPFPYAELESLSNKIIYYESSRGCPFSCAYCISSVTEGVRFVDIDIVKTHLDFFLKNNVKLIKFVDRTFNCDPKRAHEIWQYIIATDNGVTSFHFEIGADLLTDEHIGCLARARKGLIQFEAGVQSTNPETLKEICRAENFKKLSENIIKIKSLRNIHVHLDLIAGLPFEDFASFKKSFNDCFALRPDMLQLGFLKLLKGSALRANADNYDIVYRDKAPYEVLSTKHISFYELMILKDIEHLLELYYNSGFFLASLEYAQEMFSTAFDFFYDFSIYWNKEDFHRVSHSKQALHEILFGYLKSISGIDLSFVKDLLKFDMFIKENNKNLPDWLERTDYKTISDSIHAFFADEDNAKKYFPKLAGYSPKQLSRLCHIEHFYYNVLDFVNSGQKNYCQNYCLFVYEDRKPKVYSVILQ